MVDEQGPRAGGTTDSAGRPWAGRTLPPGPPDGVEADGGGCDPELASALESSDLDPDLRTARVAAALAAGRVMVAVVAVLGAQARTVHGTADKQADMALVTLTAPDGRRALPVFSSIRSLAAWDASARPVPAATRRAAVSAISEGCSVLVLDPSGPVACELSWSVLVALAEGRAWSPSHADPQVLTAAGGIIGSEPEVAAHSCSRGPGGVLRIVLTMHPGTGADDLRDVLDRLSRRLGEDDLLRRRSDGIVLTVRPGRTGD